MKQRGALPPFVLCAGLLVAVSACASSGVFRSANLTNVELSSGNYEIVATGVVGEASAGYLLGLSAAAGAEPRTIALARVTGSGSLLADALESLWRNFESEHGSADGRQLALANVRFDSDALNLILFTRQRVSVRADVVEFTEP